jgi:hypothetical protein
MSSLARTQVMHYGYHLTLRALREGFQPLAEIFARHQIATTMTCLDAPPPGGDAAINNLPAAS